jgi:hypothetical protein
MFPDINRIQKPQERQPNFKRKSGCDRLSKLLVFPIGLVIQKILVTEIKFRGNLHVRKTFIYFRISI